MEIGHLSIIFQFVMLISAFTACVVMLKRNRRYLGNQLFSAAYFCYGWVGLSMFIYNTIPNDFMIQTFVRVTLAASAFAGAFLYLGTKVVFYSTKQVTKKQIIAFIAVASFLSLITPLFPNLVVTNSYDPVDNTINNTALGIVLIWQIVLVIIVIHYMLGLRGELLETERETRAEKSLSVKKMELVTLGHTLGLVGIFFIIIGNLLEIVFFDILFHLLSSIDFAVTAYGLLKTK